MYDTALCRLPVWLYGQSVGRVISKSQTVEPLLDEDILVTASVDEQSDKALSSATGTNPNDEKRRRRNQARS